MMIRPNRKRYQHHNNKNNKKEEPPVEEPPVEEAPAAVEEPPVEEPAVAPPAPTLDQEYAEYKSWSGLHDMTLSEYLREKAWKQKMELYDTSMIDVWPS